MPGDKVKSGRLFPASHLLILIGPLSYYTQAIGGDVATLPVASFLSRFTLSKDDNLFVDGVELQRCVNLFGLPEAWHGKMALAKRMPWSVVDKTCGGDTFVAATIVPMGWSLSADLIQHVLRSLICYANLITPARELRVGQTFSLDQGVMTCIDGFDIVSKVPPSRPRFSNGRLFPLHDVVRVCVFP